MKIVRRKIDARRNTLPREGLENFARNIVLERRIHNAKVGRLCLKHTEAGMMFGCKDDIANAGQFGESGPILRIEFAGVERLRQVFEKALRVVVGRADERMANHRAELAVHAPMNEQAKALVTKPFHLVGVILCLGWHECRCQKKGEDRS